MKKIMPVFVVLVLVALTVVGCGVPQEDYDKLAQDYADLEDEAASLQEQLEAAQGELAALQQDYDALLVDYDGLQQEYDGLNAEADRMNQESEAWVARLDEANLKFGIIAELLLPILTGDGLGEEREVSNVSALIEEWGDPTAQEKFDAWSASPTNRNTANDLLVYVQEDLEAGLTE